MLENSMVKDEDLELRNTLSSHEKIKDVDESSM